MKTLAITMAVLMLAGCQSKGPKKASSAQNNLINDSVLANFTKEHNQLIANNLVNSMSQISGLYPVVTTLQIPEMKTPFGSNLLSAIEEAGYGQQAVAGDIGSNLLRYRVTNSESEQGYKTQYRIEAGNGYVERDYRILDGDVMPASPMRISGTSTEIELDDHLFNSSIPLGANSYAVIMSEGVPDIRVFSADGSSNNDATVVSNKPFSSDLNTASANDDNSLNSLLANYEELIASTLVFANDSMRLGEQNKLVIKKLVAAYDPEAEIFSVLGCSQGDTSVDNGNQYLAEERAGRVVEELLLLGVSENSIFEEGCWGEEHADKDAPTRGVVLSRQRLKTG